MPLDQLISSPEDEISALELQRRPGPDNPQWKIPPGEWPAVLRRVGQGETYRQIAKHYEVSYEAVRRVVKAARRKE